jgi:hypothetical protein
MRAPPAQTPGAARALLSGECGFGLRSILGGGAARGTSRDVLLLREVPVPTRDGPRRSVRRCRRALRILLQRSPPRSWARLPVTWGGIACMSRTGRACARFRRSRAGIHAGGTGGRSIAACYRSGGREVLDTARSSPYRLLRPHFLRQDGGLRTAAARYTRAHFEKPMTTDNHLATGGCSSVRQTQS